MCCTISFVFATSLFIIFGAGAMIMFGFGVSAPDGIFWALAVCVTAFGISCIVLVVRMIVFFYKMGMNYLNIFEDDM